MLGVGKHQLAFTAREQAIEDPLEFSAFAPALLVARGVVLSLFTSVAACSGAARLAVRIEVSRAFFLISARIRTFAMRAPMVLRPSRPSETSPGAGVPKMR